MTIGYYWYLLPLLVAIALVYAATRQEVMSAILPHAWRTAVWIVGFMLIIFLLLFAVNRFV
ncbi:hypothetical protein JCM19992_24590 [Thermostilla marina]